MAEVLKKFGKYFLLDQIAQGGMAEIYRARLAGVDGAGRILVIKRIQAGFGENDEFLQMFKSEIKVTMGFNHPNIVQLYDFGEEQNQPYIAMELVDGKNLRQFLSRITENKNTFPVELAAFIIEQSASGLHYAHSYKDKITGQPLNLVHRDISPQNILVSFEGNAKIIDFGIAKARTNSESTRAGIIKGKPSYLSPEQISGEQLDGRCDVFALGIVLWELLAGRKLFAGENELAVLRLIESCNSHVKPPSTVNPAVPKDLDYIVLKTLAKQREKRYQSAEELQRALHKFVYSNSPDFNPGDLAYFAKDLFKNEILEDRKKLQALNEKAEQLMCSQVLHEDKSVPELATTARDDDTTAVIGNRPAPAPKQMTSLGAGDLQLEVEVAKKSRPSAAAAPKGAKPSGRTATGTGGFASTGAPRQQQEVNAKGGGAGKIVLVLAVLFVGGVVFGPELGIEIPFVSGYVDKFIKSGKNAKTSIDPAARSAPRAEPSNVPVTSIVADPAVGKSVTLRLNVVPGGGSIAMTLNGKPVDREIPVLVPLDSPLELVAERAGFKQFRREFVLDSRQIAGLKEWMVDVPMEPLRFGLLSIRTTPSADASIMMDGKPWIRKTPIEEEKMPAGTYTIRLFNELLGMEKTVTVTIIEGRSVNVDEKLEVRN